MIVAAFTRLFAEQMKSQRKNLGFSQQQLAMLLHDHGVTVSQSYLSKLESGQRAEPSIQLVIATATILHISLDAIIQNVQKVSENEQ